MAYEPAGPTIIRPPERIAEETWLIHQVQEALGAPLRVYLHTGNLAQVMEQCPNATLLASWALVERFSNAFEFPLHRCRWVDDGSHLDLDDRRLRFVRPPLWDSPTTRGVLDTSTDVYWAVDAFATPCSTAVEASVDELDVEAWRAGVAMFAHHALSPWLALVDDRRYRHHVEKVRALGATTIASAHSPPISGASVDTAFDLLVDLPNVEVPPAPDQAVLDVIVAQLPAA